MPPTACQYTYEPGEVLLPNEAGKIDQFTEEELSYAPTVEVSWSFRYLMTGKK